MKRSGAWMTIWDDRILAYARNMDSVTPAKLDETGFFPISRVQISRRLKKLAEHGLLKPLGNGVYVITERGEGYLDGEISTREDEPDEIPDDTNNPTDIGEESNG